MLQYASTGEVPGATSENLGFEYRDELPFPIAAIQDHRVAVSIAFLAVLAEQFRSSRERR